MGAGIAASPHCAERRICRCSVYLVPLPERFGTPLLDPGSPAQASLSTVQLSPKRSPDFYSTAPPEGSLVFRRPARLKTEVLALNRSMFRGPSWDNLSRVPLRSPNPTRRSGSRVARQEDHLFRRLFPAGPSRTRKFFPFLPAEIGSSVPSSPLLPLPAFPGRLGLPPRSLEDHALSIRVAEAKFSVTSLWITGISGTTIGTLSSPPSELPIRSPFPTSAKCLNRLH